MLLPGEMLFYQEIQLIKIGLPSESVANCLQHSKIPTF